VALTTLAKIKILLSISGSGEDDRLNEVVDASDDIISRWCDRDFDSTAYTEYYDGTGTAVLVLRQYPIIGNPSEVNVDGNRDFAATTALTVSDDYIVETNGAEGILRLVSAPFQGTLEPVWPRGIQNIKVTYTAGYATLPAGLVHIATQYSAFLYRNRATFGPMATSMGGVSIRWDSINPNSTVDLIPDAFKAQLETWRRHDVDYVYFFPYEA